MSKVSVFHGRVNHGTQAGLFARELRKHGYDALSVVHPDPFKRLTDIELKHGGNFLERAVKHVWNYIFRIYCLFKFDIYHFYYGETLLPKQLDLPILKVLGRKIIMEYLGNDIQGYQRSIDTYKWTNVAFMMTPEQGRKSDLFIKKRYQFEQKYIDKTLVCAPVYSEFVDNAQVLPLGVNLIKFEYTALPEFNGVFRIMHAPTDRGFKGTDFIEKAILRLKDSGYAIEFDLVENVTHAELLKRYQQCHLFIDQILGGWYGTASIEAMATGRPVVVSIRQEYFKYINFGDKIPAIHADPDIIYEVLKNTLDKGYDYLAETGKKSRKFVEEYHDVKMVTKQLVEIYNKL